MSSPVYFTVVSTVPRPDGYRPVLAKMHGPRAGQLRDYDSAFLFMFERVEILTIEELYELLRLLGPLPYYAIVRGEPRPDVDFGQPQRRLLDTQPDGATPTIVRGAPGRWLAFDLDRSAPAPDIDWRTHPREAAEAILQRDLPSWVNEADHVAYWSGSQGFKDGMRLRVFVLLEQPLSSPAAKILMKSLADTGSCPVDLGLYSDAQLHFTATPIFRGSVVDPLSNGRHYLFKRSRRRALAPPVPSTFAAMPHSANSVRTGIGRLPEPAKSSTARRVFGGRGGSSSPAIEAVIATMGEQSAGKSGFHVPWNRALAIFFAQNGPDADPRPLIVRLARVIVSRGSRDEAYFQRAVQGMVRRARVLAALERDRRDTLTKLRAVARQGLLFNAEKETSHG